MARSPIGDAADMMKAFPQITWDEYLYKRSYAQLQIMAMDNTHVKYLKGKDKKIWDNYKEIIKAQTELENLFANNRSKINNEQ